MMNMSIEQAAEIYAKYMRAWYGIRAEALTLEKIDELRSQSDEDGVQSWTLVLQNIRELSESRPAGHLN